jgi:hypothetical protein
MQEAPMKPCPDCEGLGIFENISNCCDAAREPDLELCYNCHGHCGPAICETCKGTGKVEMDTEDLERQAHEAELDKMDNFRDE